MGQPVLFIWKEVTDPNTLAWLSPEIRRTSAGYAVAPGGSSVVFFGKLALLQAKVKRSKEVVHVTSQCTANYWSSGIAFVDR